MHSLSFSMTSSSQPIHLNSIPRILAWGYPEPLPALLLGLERELLTLVNFEKCWEDELEPSGQELDLFTVEKLLNLHPSELKQFFAEHHPKNQKFILLAMGSFLSVYR